MISALGVLFALECQAGCYNFEQGATPVYPISLFLPLCIGDRYENSECTIAHQQKIPVTGSCTLLLTA